MLREQYILEFDERFDEGKINLQRWIPYYLPQWSSREQSKPNYRFENNHLVLQITKEQQPWCPEFNGDVKVSSLQTGLYAGKLNTDKAQHKFNKRCVVREEQLNQKKYLPQYGYFEIRAKALDTASNVVALWMIGYLSYPKEFIIDYVKGYSHKLP